MNQQEKSIPIAVTGMACRLPGGIHNTDQFWNLLVSGQDAIQDIPANRWNQNWYYSSDRTLPGTLISPQGGFIDRIDLFDHRFFGFSALEAANIDPQQRLLLQVTWEALEQGNIPCDQWAGKAVGVFIGCFSQDYHMMQFSDPLELGAFSTTGIMNTMLSNRISYFFDFTGPSMSIDTACSASMTAIHQACISLQRKESEMAVAGGSMLMLLPDYHIAETKTGLLSKDGRCKSFSADANGYVRSEGVSIVILKRLDDAIVAGDQIQGVIIGSAVNQDGHTSGITLPNGNSQKEVMRMACKNAGINPSDVTYIEAHGTGTASGDPIEANAIGTVYCIESKRENPLWVGSCKSNIGHTESASGIVGLIKTILCLKNKQIPPNLHLEKLNPSIPFNQLKINIPKENVTIHSGDKPLIAGVNSFGFGGSNAHVLVKAYDPPPKKSIPVSTGFHLFPVSAKSIKALQESAGLLSEKISKDKESHLSDWCANVSQRRVHMPKRKSFISRDKKDLSKQLYDFSISELSEDYAEHGSKKMIWIFPGIGRLFYGISHYLYQKEPVFHEMYDLCDKIFSSIAGFSLSDILNSAPPDTTITDPVISQQAQFFHQVSLAALWRDRGIRPDAIVGYSSGEFAAFQVAGSYSLRECINLIYHRTKIVTILQGTGAMLAVNSDALSIQPFLEKFAGKICIAAYNSPNHITLSGKKEYMIKLSEILTKHDITNTFLWEEVAYHHTDILNEEAKNVHLNNTPKIRQPEVELYSATTGGLITNENFRNDHWVKNIIEPVLFNGIIEKILQRNTPYFLELSGKPMLIPYLYSIINNKKGYLLNPLKTESGELDDFQTISNIFEKGFDVNWQSVYREYNWVDLVSYPWQNEHLWQEPVKSREKRFKETVYESLGSRVEGQSDQWETVISLEKQPWLSDHIVIGECILPGAVYIEMALAALTQKYPGNHFIIEDLRFARMLKLKQNNANFIRFYLEPHHMSFRIAATESLWPIEFKDVASGKFRFVAPGQFQPINIDKKMKGLNFSVEGKDMYSFFHSLQYSYGKAFQGLKKVYIDKNESLCEIMVDKTFIHDTFHFHPVALDIIFHSMLAIKYKHNKDDLKFEIPIGIDQIRIFGRPEPEMFALARLTEQSESTTKADLLLYSEKGKPLGIISGFKTRTLKSGNNRNQDKKNLSGSLSVPKWEETDFKITSGNKKKKNFLILTDKKGLGNKLYHALTQSGMNVSLLDPSFISCANESEIVRELKTILITLPPDTEIISCLALNANNIHTSITFSTLPVTYLSRTIRETGFSGKIWFITREAQLIKDLSERVNIFQAPLWGISNVFGNQEFRENYKGIIDVGCHEDIDFLTEVLTSEKLPDKELVIRNNRIFVRKLTPLQTTKHAVSISFNPNETYLVTGALGAIGKKIVEWMISAGARSLLLTTSRPLDSEAKISHDELWINFQREKGAKIDVIQVDFTDMQSVDSFKNKIKLRNIKGVIYCAGFSKDQLLEDIDQKSLTKIMHTKLSGAWILHNIFLAKPLEHFILFSSIGSILPNRGLGSYAAANAALDALAQQRYLTGLPALSINWGPWSIGMFEHAKFEKAFSMIGINDIKPEQGIRLLENVFFGEYPQVIIQRTNWAKFLSSSLANHTLYENFLHFGKEDKSNAGECIEFKDVRKILLQEIAKLSDDTGNNLDVQMSLKDYGMDSISAMILSDMIRIRWGINFSVDKLYAMESIELLISKIFFLLSEQQVTKAV